MADRGVPRIVAVVAVVFAVSAALVATAAPGAGQGAGFGDVPDDAYYTVPVSALAEQGVFAGTLCDDGFCPGEAIDRKTMAVWTVRMLDGQDPPAVAEARFDDVDASSFYAPFIERMADLEVTRGCGDGSGFCPDRNVTRAQMAAFLSRAYSLPEGPDPEFLDVPDDAWYASDVAKLAASGITVGCGDGTRFCPARETTRAHMATFLARAQGPTGHLWTEVSSGSGASIAAGKPFEVTIEFARAVSGLAADDIKIVNGEIEHLAGFGLPVSGDCESCRAGHGDGAHTQGCSPRPARQQQ